MNGRKVDVAKAGNGWKRGAKVQETFLTIEEAAELLRISARSAYTLAREGRLAGAVKVGNQWRVDRVALMAWVKEEGQPKVTEQNESGL